MIRLFELIYGQGNEQYILNLCRLHISDGERLDFEFEGKWYVVEQYGFRGYEKDYDLFVAYQQSYERDRVRDTALRARIFDWLADNVSNS